MAKFQTCIIKPKYFVTNSLITKRAFAENQEFTEYLDFLQETMVYSSCSSDLANAGQEVNIVGKQLTSKEKKSARAEARSERALWFLQSFGFTLDSIKVKDSVGNISKMKYNENGCTNRINSQELPEKG